MSDTKDAQCMMLNHSVLSGISGQGNTGAAGEAGQRAVALRCLAGACESGQLLVDIFVNYDCDLEGANLFERLVLALVRTAQAAPSASDTPAAAADEAHLRLLVSASNFPACAPQFRRKSRL